MKILIWGLCTWFTTIMGTGAGELLREPGLDPCKRRRCRIVLWGCALTALVEIVVFFLILLDHDKS